MFSKFNAYNTHTPAHTHIHTQTRTHTHAHTHTHTHTHAHTQTYIYIPTHTHTHTCTESMVYDILLPNTATTAYATGLWKLSANRRSSEIQGTALSKCLQAWPVYIGPGLRV